MLSLVDDFLAFGNIVVLYEVYLLFVWRIS